MNKVRKSKKLLVMTLLVGLTLFFGCKGQPGSVYLAYSWVYTPLYLYDENPSTPSTVHNGDYFLSSPGVYYMEYLAWDGSGWWMTYTLTANPGELFWVDGADAKFEIALYSSGPGITQWSNLAEGKKVAQLEGESAIQASNEIAKNESRIGPEHELESVALQGQMNGYSLSISAGRLRGLK